MKLLLKIYHTFFAKFPDSGTIDKSGIICSDHPKEGNGWIKGWVVSPNTIIVCKHSIPSTSPPNNKVFVFDKFGKKIIRNIVAIDNRSFSNKELDIAICKVDEDFPISVKCYKIATKISDYQKSILFDQSSEESISSIITDSKELLIKGKSRKNQLDAGDSGTPWFVWEDNEWKVATHTFKGMYGVGPWYSEIYKDIKDRISDIS